MSTGVMVGLHMKSMLLGKLFAVSRNWLVSPGSAIGVETPENKENKRSE